MWSSSPADRAERRLGADNGLNPARQGGGRTLRPQCSHRARAPFISVNCAAIPENLLESDSSGTRRRLHGVGRRHRHSGSHRRHPLPTRFRRWTRGCRQSFTARDQETPCRQGRRNEAVLRHPASSRPRTQHGRGQWREGILPRGFCDSRLNVVNSRFRVRERPADVTRSPSTHQEMIADAKKRVPVRPDVGGGAPPLGAQTAGRQCAGAGDTIPPRG